MKKQKNGISTSNNTSVISKTATSGITLIALVITIIVLLILAGVTISTLTGDNGILTQANKAKSATTQAEIEEQVKLAVINSRMETDSESVISETKRKNIEEELQKTSADSTVKIVGDFLCVKHGGKYFQVDKNYNVQELQDFRGKNLLDLGEWKLTCAKNWHTAADLSITDENLFWKKEDGYVSTGIKVARPVVRYSNGLVIDWSKYTTITVKFKGTWSGVTSLGVGYGDGSEFIQDGSGGYGINSVVKTMLTTTSGGTGEIQEITGKLSDFSDVLIEPTTIYFQEASWYAATNIAFEIYEIRLD